MNNIPITNKHLFTKNDVSQNGLFLSYCEVFYILSEDGELITVNRVYHATFENIDNILIEGIEVCWKDNPFELSFTEDNYVRIIKPD